MAGTQQGKVTDAQATLALQQLTGVDLGVEEPEKPAEQEAAPAEQPAEQPADTAEAAAQTAEEAETPAETDDVQSLKQRLETEQAEREREKKLFDSRWRAIQERNTQNQRILRDRYVRKSSIADKALRTLRAVRSEAGVPEADVDRVIQELQGTMNPESASYAPLPETHALAVEDQTITLNSFLNEKGMTPDEADEFGKWIRSEAQVALSPQEQAVAAQSLDGFLRIAHNRWQSETHETEKTKRQADAVAAVRAVQRTQREAARAATTSTAAPRKQPTGPKPIDLKKLSRDDISELLRKSVEEAKAGNY